MSHQKSNTQLLFVLLCAGLACCPCSGTPPTTSACSLAQALRAQHASRGADDGHGARALQIRRPGDCAHGQDLAQARQRAAADGRLGRLRYAPSAPGALTARDELHASLFNRPLLAALQLSLPLLVQPASDGFNDRTSAVRLPHHSRSWAVSPHATVGEDMPQRRPMHSRKLWRAALYALYAPLPPFL